MSRLAGMRFCDSEDSSAGRRLRASSASSPLTFASSAFCADVGVDLGNGNAQHVRAGAHLPVDLALDLRFGLQVVPQAVDLVQDDDAAGLGRGIVAGEVLVPHLEVGLGDAGVGGQDEEQRVRVRQKVQRELGLGADRIEARRVEDHEPLLQQRMREVDHRVAPAGDVDAAFVAMLERRENVVLAVAVKAVLPRELDRDALHLRHARQRLAHLVGGGQVERNVTHSSA